MRDFPKLAEIYTTSSREAMLQDAYKVSVTIRAISDIIAKISSKPSYTSGEIALDLGQIDGAYRDKAMEIIKEQKVLCREKCKALYDGCMRNCDENEQKSRYDFGNVDDGAYDRISAIQTKYLDCQSQCNSKFDMSKCFEYCVKEAGRAAVRDYVAGLLKEFGDKFNDYYREMTPKDKRYLSELRERSKQSPQGGSKKRKKTGVSRSRKRSKTTKAKRSKKSSLRKRSKSKKRSRTTRKH
jgi:hypothetical protein